MDKEQMAITRLQDAARLSLHRYGKPLLITYSGGKDSQVLVALAERSGISIVLRHGAVTFLPTSSSGTRMNGTDGNI